MTQPEYDLKKRECWEEFCRANPSHNKSIFARKVFDYTFDRAYALGKQFGNSEQVIEEAAEKHADEMSVPSNIPGALVPMLHDIAKSSYICGAQDALDKQIETITQEEIEKASVKFADREYEIGQVDWDALYKGYYHGMKDSLGKQEKDPEETAISGWVARDDGERWRGRELHLFTRNKPERRKLMGDWIGRPSMTLDSNLFPDLTWESDPEPVEIIIKRKKK